MTWSVAPAATREISSETVAPALRARLVVATTLLSLKLSQLWDVDEVAERVSTHEAADHR
jgi:hypothetical protein